MFDSDPVANDTIGDVRTHTDQAIFPDYRVAAQITLGFDYRTAVSYTHLDVYKRQGNRCSRG